MYDIVLLTTGENEVRKKILQDDPDALVVDCEVGRTEVLGRLEHAMNRGVRQLLTYRCPYIIPCELYSRAKCGAYNIHPSLLPDYAGLNPWVRIFEDKVRNSGVTLHRISDIPDGGEILGVSNFEICADDTLDSARQKADIAAVKLIRYIEDDRKYHSD